MRNTLTKLLVISSLAASSASADFTGHFVPGNWTFSTAGNGFVTSHTATNLVFSGSNGGTLSSVSTNISISAPSAGTVTFNWNYTNADVGGAAFDPFYFVVNGFENQLTANTPSNQSGSSSFPVGFGDFFGFRITATDDQLGVGAVNISNFNFTPSGAEVPFGVDSTLGLGLLGAAAAFKFRRRRKA